MFDKNTYIRRRNELKKLINDGIVILFGNNESPMNYPANAYYPHRQDSTFIYSCLKYLVIIISVLYLLGTTKYFPVIACMVFA